MACSSKSREAIDRGNSGPEASDLILQVLSWTFDQGGAASAFTELHNFCVTNGTPYTAYYRAFRIVVEGDVQRARVSARVGAGTGDCASQRKRDAFAVRAQNIPKKAGNSCSAFGFG